MSPLAVDHFRVTAPEPVSSVSVSETTSAESGERFDAHLHREAEPPRSADAPPAKAVSEEDREEETEESSIEEPTSIVTPVEKPVVTPEPDPEADVEVMAVDELASVTPQASSSESSAEEQAAVTIVLEPAAVDPVLGPAEAAAADPEADPSSVPVPVTTTPAPTVEVSAEPATALASMGDGEDARSGLLHDSQDSRDTPAEPTADTVALSSEPSAVPAEVVEVMPTPPAPEAETSGGREERKPKSKIAEPPRDVAPETTARPTEVTATQHAAKGPEPLLEEAPNRSSKRPPAHRTDSAVTAVPGNSEAAGVTQPSRLAQHLVARADERPGKAASLSDTDQARFLDRVAGALRAAENRQGTLKLRLHPPDLGSLRVELRVQNGSLVARLEAETTSAQSLLLEHAQTLRDRLEEIGVRIERFDVDLSRQGSADQSSTFEQRPSRDGSPSGHRRREEPLVPTRENNATAVTRAIPAPGQLNVII